MRSWDVPIFILNTCFLFSCHNTLNLMFFLVFVKHYYLLERMHGKNNRLLFVVAAKAWVWEWMDEWMSGSDQNDWPLKIPNWLIEECVLSWSIFCSKEQICAFSEYFLSSLLLGCQPILKIWLILIFIASLQIPYRSSPGLIVRSFTEFNPEIVLFGNATKAFFTTL